MSELLSEETCSFVLGAEVSPFTDGVLDQPLTSEGASSSHQGSLDLCEAGHVRGVASEGFNVDHLEASEGFNVDNLGGRVQSSAVETDEVARSQI